jgi:hypothetical protein
LARAERADVAREARKWCANKLRAFATGWFMAHEIRFKKAAELADSIELGPEAEKSCSHEFASNHGMYDTEHRYCTKCSVAE